MIARLVDAWRQKTDWSYDFWLFAVKFYTMPWFAWHWLSARKNGSLNPIWQRSSSTLIGLIHVGLLGVLIWLVIWSLGDPFVTAILTSLIAFKLVTIIFRAQVMYVAFGGDDHDLKAKR